MQADIPMLSPRQTTMNEDTQQRNGEDGISSNIEDRTDSVHIHAAGRVLIPSSIRHGIDVGDRVLKERILALFGGNENYITHRLDEKKGSIRDEILGNEYVNFPLDRRKPEAPEAFDHCRAEGAKRSRCSV